MSMSLSAAHDLLVTIQSKVADTKATQIFGVARLEIESLMAKGSPDMLASESDLPTKRMRVEAYRDRTKCSTTVAHAVVNMNWRSQQRLVGK